MTDGSNSSSKPTQPGIRAAVRETVPKCGDTDQVLLTVSQAAARLGVSRATTYRLIQRGDLDAVHVGKALRVPAKAVNDYVDRLVESEKPVVSDQPHTMRPVYRDEASASARAAGKRG